MIPDIVNINTNNSVIPNVGIGNASIREVRGVTLRYVRNPNIQEIADRRVWLREQPQAPPQQLPVTVSIGAPIVDMPGCVEVHKENTKGNKNMNLVDNDPKGNMVLCDSGAPSYYPVDYQANELTWQTIYTEEEEPPQGVDTGDPPTPPTPTTPEPPNTPSTSKEPVECPPPNARRIGDLNQAGTERVKEYKLIKDGTICETVWEPIPFVDRYLPSPQVVTTTATIAVVATSSALLAKPLADLLLKVVKPVVKKAIGKVQKMLGKTPHRSTPSEIRTNRYREKKGMLGIDFAKKKKPLKKSEPST